MISLLLGGVGGTLIAALVYAVHWENGWLQKHRRARQLSTP